MRIGQRQERPVPVNTHICLEQDVEASGRHKPRGLVAESGSRWRGGKKTGSVVFSEQSEVWFKKERR